MSRAKKPKLKPVVLPEHTDVVDLARVEQLAFGYGLEYGKQKAENVAKAQSAAGIGPTKLEEAYAAVFHATRCVANLSELNGDFIYRVYRAVITAYLKAKLADPSSSLSLEQAATVKALIGEADTKA